MKWWPSPCRYGDMIRVQIGSIWHYGIYVSDDEVIQFGAPPRGSLPPYEQIEVCATDIDVFSGGSSVEVAQYTLGEKLTRRSRKQIVQAARQRLGEKGYDILRNNCEHFATQCVFGRPSSSQTDALPLVKREWTAVWVAKLAGGPEPSVIFPPLRKQQIDETSDPLLKRQRIFDWQVLSDMIGRLSGKRMQDLSFSKTPGGKWECDGLYFSLSHSEDWIAAAVSDQPVGVDIEVLSSKTDEKLKAALSRFLTDDELKAHPPTSMTDRFAMWTRKESLFKQSGFCAFDPLSIPLADPSIKTCISKDNWCLSVSAKSRQDICPYLWDGEKTHALEVVNWRP